MVFFSCDGCGEMLKKNQVDTHANRCRRCDSVSCVDCAVSFFGDDYRAHTSCMTEAERYEGKLYKANKKRNPQEEWMDIVNDCAEKAPLPLQRYFRTMTTLDNIPRKEKQFRNFTANSLGLRGSSAAVVGQIWDVLKAEREKRQAVKQKLQQEQKAKQDEARKKREAESKKTVVSESSSDDSSDDDSDDDKKKEKRKEEKPEIEKESSPKKKAKKTEEKKEKKPEKKASVDPKKVKKAMKKALKKAPNRSMKIKDLRNVLREKLGLPKSARKKLKEVLLDVPKSSKKKVDLKVDGKTITLL